MIFLPVFAQYSPILDSFFGIVCNVLFVLSLFVAVAIVCFSSLFLMCKDTNFVPNYKMKLPNVFWRRGFAVSRGWSYPRSFSPATMVSGQKLNTEAISPAMQKPQSEQMSVPSPMQLPREPSG